MQVGSCSKLGLIHRDEYTVLWSRSPHDAVGLCEVGCGALRHHGRTQHHVGPPMACCRQRTNASGRVHYDDGCIRAPAVLSFSVRDCAMSVLVCALLQPHRARSAHRRACLPASAAAPIAPPPQSAALTALPAAHDSVSVLAVDGDVHFSSHGHVHLLSSMPEQLPCVSQHLATLLYGRDLQ